MSTLLSPLISYYGSKGREKQRRALGLPNLLKNCEKSTPLNIFSCLIGAFTSEKSVPIQSFCKYSYSKACMCHNVFDISFNYFCEVGVSSGTNIVPVCVHKFCHLCVFVFKSDKNRSLIKFLYLCVSTVCWPIICLTVVFGYVEFKSSLLSLQASRSKGLFC